MRFVIGHRYVGLGLEMVDTQVTDFSISTEGDASYAIQHDPRWGVGSSY